MKLLFGLGNPGSQYEKTRHNAGFMAVEKFAQQHGATNWRSSHEGFLCDVMVNGEKIIVLRPMTYINLSGRSLASAARFYKIEVPDILVVVDDIALPVGTIRLRASGSDGGHNGLKDIAAALSTQDYGRLRIGIDHPGRVPQKDYVLERFSPAQLPKLELALENAVSAIELWLAKGLSAAMNKFNAAE